MMYSLYINGSDDPIPVEYRNLVPRIGEQISYCNGPLGQGNFQRLRVTDVIHLVTDNAERGSFTSIVAVHARTI